MQISHLEKPAEGQKAEFVVIGVVTPDPWDADLSLALTTKGFHPFAAPFLACDEQGVWFCVQGEVTHCIENQPEIRRFVLCFIGETLHGSEWQASLADELCMGSRSVRYFASGERSPNEGIIRDALALCAAKAQKLQPLATASFLVRRPC